MKARTAWMFIVALALGFGSTGCVAQKKVDDYQRLYRQAQEQIIDLQARIEESNARIAALQNAGPDAATLGQLQQLQAERERLQQALAVAEAQLREAGRQEVALPPELDVALRELAAQNPDLMSYDPELGMVKFRSDLTFPLGSAEVSPQAQQTLQRLARVLVGPAAQDYEVRVVGHTDAVPVKNPQTRARHPNNWYLSAHRAISVREVLQNTGVSPSRLGVAGYGEYRPVVPHGPRGNAEANRRVEIYLVAMPTSTFDAAGVGAQQQGQTQQPQASPQPTLQPAEPAPAPAAEQEEGPEMFK